MNDLTRVLLWLVALLIITMVVIFTSLYFLFTSDNIYMETACVIGLIVYGMILTVICNL